MDIILIPGFWLDASSWSDVIPILEEAGHRTHPVTLPGLESDDADLVDLDDDLRSRFRARAVPEPARVASDPLSLADERRYDVPVTVIASEFPSSMLVEFIAADAAFTRELARVNDVSYIDLPTGHWPQFTKPVQLGQAIAAAVR